MALGSMIETDKQEALSNMVDPNFKSNNVDIRQASEGSMRSLSEVQQGILNNIEQSQGAPYTPTQRKKILTDIYTYLKAEYTKAPKAQLKKRDQYNPGISPVPFDIAVDIIPQLPALERYAVYSNEYHSAYRFLKEHVAYIDHNYQYCLENRADTKDDPNSFLNTAYNDVDAICALWKTLQSAQSVLLDDLTPEAAKTFFAATLGKYIGRLHNQDMGEDTFTDPDMPSCPEGIGQRLMEFIDKVLIRIPAPHATFIKQDFKDAFILDDKEKNLFSVSNGLYGKTLAELQALHDALENYVTEGFNEKAISADESKLLGSFIRPQGYAVYSFINKMHQKYDRDYFTTQLNLHIDAKAYDNFGSYILNLADNPYLHFSQEILHEIQQKMQTLKTNNAQTLVTPTLPPDTYLTSIRQQRMKIPVYYNGIQPPPPPPTGINRNNRHLPPMPPVNATNQARPLNRFRDPNGPPIPIYLARNGTTFSRQAAANNAPPPPPQTHILDTGAPPILFAQANATALAQQAAAAMATRGLQNTTNAANTTRSTSQGNALN